MSLTADASLLLAAAVAYTAVCAWLFRVQSVATGARDGVNRIDEERKADKIAYNRRLEKAEEVASDLKALAQSVKGLTELMEQEARHQVERHNDLKAEFQRATTSAAVAKETATRRNNRAGPQP